MTLKLWSVLKWFYNTKKKNLFQELITSFINFISAGVRIGRTFISCESWHNRITPESVESFRNYWTKLVKWLICSCGFEVSVSYYWIYFHKLDTTCLNLSYSNYLTKTMVLYQIIFIILFYSNYLYFSICKFSLCNLHKQMDFPFFSLCFV